MIPNPALVAIIHTIIVLIASMLESISHYGGIYLRNCSSYIHYSRHSPTYLYCTISGQPNFSVFPDQVMADEQKNIEIIIAASIRLNWLSIMISVSHYYCQKTPDTRIFKEQHLQ